MVCNVCGKRLKFYETMAISVDQPIQYGSVHDMGWLHLEMCAKCMDKLIEKCKINPVKGGCD